MDRREALKRVGLLMGGAVSASTMSGILSGCRVDPEAPAYALQTLSPDQNELVATLAECIIPATDTPGARAARVNEFIDLMLTDWHRPAERDHFLAGLADVDARAQQEHGSPFVDLTPEQQTALLAALEADAIAYAERQQERVSYDEFGQEVDRTTEEPSHETNREPANTPVARQQMDEELEQVAVTTPFFTMMKELTLAGYYTSEIGATEELRDMPFGTYDGNVPFSEIGRAWS